MGKGLDNIVELIDETVKKVALGLYINLNHNSYTYYKKSFKLLVIENPLQAYNLIKEISSSSTTRLLFKIICRALNFDSSKIDSIVDSLENGDEKPFKDMIDSIQ
ncbi:hypothetical protein [Caldisphaera sp.]|uniref:hypothetical protein n=1 Tax=Caldisphaera sp. TaxID=2060322 RepID=UPI0025BCAD36|nr:hypothetical protein [Caldisphaera sp.]